MVASGKRIDEPATVAPIAQLVEQRTFNPRVLGSSPSGCTNMYLTLEENVRDQTEAEIIRKIAKTYCKMTGYNSPPAMFGDMLSILTSEEIRPMMQELINHRQGIL